MQNQILNAQENGSFMAKRPRHTGRPRKPKRPIDLRDFGTLDALRRKAEILGVDQGRLIADMVTVDMKAGVKRIDIAMAENPLGVMLARGVVGEAQHAAGQKFARARYRRFGRPFERAAGLAPWIKGEGEPPGDPEKDLENRAAYADAFAALSGAGRDAMLEVLNCAVHQRFPGWYARQHSLTIRTGDERRRAAFFAGLARLVAHYRTNAQATERSAA